MTSTLKLLAVPLAILFFLSPLGCSTSPVHDTRDSAADTAKYRTYKWLEQADVQTLRLQDPDINYFTGDVRILHVPDIEKHVRDVIQSDLEKAGLHPAGGNPPDAYVTFFSKTPSGDWNSTWQGRAPGLNAVPVIAFPNFDRALIRAARADDDVFLVIYDAKTKKPAWTGAIRRSELGGSVTSPQFAKAADELIKHFMS